MLEHVRSLTFGLVAVITLINLINLCYEDLDYYFGRVRNTVANSGGQIALQYLIRILIILICVAAASW
jgi:hypothetical protein